MLRNQLGKDLKRMKNCHNQSFQHYSRSVYGYKSVKYLRIFDM